MAKQLSEHSEQSRFIALVRRMPHPAARWTYAIPNGFLRTKSMRIRAWREGLLSGVADIHCHWRTEAYTGLWIEMKRSKGGKLSEEQKAFLEHVKEQGGLGVVCTSAEAAFRVWCKYLGIPLAP